MLNANLEEMKYEEIESHFNEMVSDVQDMLNIGDDLDVAVHFKASPLIESKLAYHYAWYAREATNASIEKKRKEALVGIEARGVLSKPTADSVKEYVDGNVNVLLARKIESYYQMFAEYLKHSLTAAQGRQEILCALYEREYMGGIQDDANLE